ncbi:uncharacterized protein DS421_19g650500 [Arachis hypogaea]|uniref:Uncharacterized protein n=1 Tax=Arachis hypogaea TaxID=3818 RepID=A0A6B9V703_ARAHY|nr:uncharacterized protein DS421_19g650500 [Arachis hypogaea]
MDLIVQNIIFEGMDGPFSCSCKWSNSVFCVTACALCCLGLANGDLVKEPHMLSKVLSESAGATHASFVPKCI